MFIPVFFSIVIGELFSRFDVLARKHKDPSFVRLYLTIRTTRMIDVSRCVKPWTSIDSLFLGDFKKILTAACIFFPSFDDAPHVFNDTGTFLNRRKGKETNACH